MESNQYLWQRPDWPQLTWNAEAILPALGLCRQLQGRLLHAVGSLGFDMENQVQAAFFTEEILKTSAIEGETLDIRSVRSSVARKLGLPVAGLPVDRRIDNIMAILLDATQNHAAPLTPERLWGWQASLFPTGYSSLTKIQVGSWRQSPEAMQVVSGPLGKEIIHYEAPPADRMDEEMNHFLLWWENSRHTLEGIVRAAIAHFLFVAIHPFDDGNGRIARALTDMALAEDDGQRIRYYSLSAQIMTDRNGYYSMLEKTSKGSGDVTDWLLWFLDCFRRAVVRSNTVVDDVAAKVRFWRQHLQTPFTERQRKVINRILDEPGGFEGKLTTRKYAAIAKVSPATAYRELDQLHQWGVLKRSGKGRSVGYELTYS
ncbi:MAG: Fic family protein [Deltaproteobacteria bacterium]|nr:Fic family protein [Deltaproteobacteria bacterium]